MIGKFNQWQSWQSVTINQLLVIYNVQGKNNRHDEYLPYTKFPKPNPGKNEIVV